MSDHVQGERSIRLLTSYHAVSDSLKVWRLADLERRRLFRLEVRAEEPCALSRVRLDRGKLEEAVLLSQRQCGIRRAECASAGSVANVRRLALVGEKVGRHAAPRVRQRQELAFAVLTPGVERLGRAGDDNAFPRSAWSAHLAGTCLCLAFASTCARIEHSQKQHSLLLFALCSIRSTRAPFLRDATATRRTDAKLG